MFNPWIVFPIYLTTFIIVALILRVINWGALLNKNYKNPGSGRAVYLLVSLAISASIGTMILMLTSIAI